jgi:hypothetical protein
MVGEVFYLFHWSPVMVLSEVAAIVLLLCLNFAQRVSRFPLISSDFV